MSKAKPKAAKPEVKKEKIKLTNGDYWIINNNPSFLEIRKAKLKNGLKFLR